MSPSSLETASVIALVEAVPSLSLLAAQQRTTAPTQPGQNADPRSDRAG